MGAFGLSPSFRSRPSSIGMPMAARKPLSATISYVRADSFPLGLYPGTEISLLLMLPAIRGNIENVAALTPGMAETFSLIRSYTASSLPAS